MLVRMFEYDAQIALDAGQVSERRCASASAILYLRCRASTPDVLTVRISRQAAVLQPTISLR